MNPAIARLLGRTLLWLPVCFAVWYFSAAAHASLAGVGLQYLVNATYPIHVPMVQKGAVLEFLLEVPAALSRNGGAGVIRATITLDLLIYSCGIPLFLALMLGTPELLRRWRDVLKGLGALLVYEIIALYVSACYNTLNMLHIIGADTRWLMGLPWNEHLNLLAQTAFALVLPSALAVFLWAGFNDAFILDQARAMPKAKKEPSLED
jgi:hypothetical protein